MTAFEYAPEERLLRALAEQLKLPLLHIARTAELNQDGSAVLDSIQYTADMAIRLVDGYLLSTQQYSQSSLQLEPVSISSVLQDIAHRLSPLAREYDQDLEVKLSGRYAPVMAHRQSLEAAYTLLGYAMVEAGGETERRTTTVLGAHRSAQGIVAGIFSDHEGLTADMFRRAKAIYGRSRQAMPSVSPTSGAGIFLADSLLSTMSAPLKVAQHNKMSGLAATLLPSQQLQLV